MKDYSMNDYNMGTLDLEHLKEAFTALVGSAEPNVLPTFFMWVDIKVAEYKCNGYMYSGPPPSRRYDGSWYSTEKYSERERKNSYGMSPDTTVQTEALELTKSPQKPSRAPLLSVPHTHMPEVPRYSASTMSPHDYSKYASQAASHHHPIAYPKAESLPVYNSHHSPVYGSEASGIINLSVKSGQNEEAYTDEAASPLKLTLKVPSVYQASSPAKPASPLHSSPSKADTKPNYSSLRSLLEARKVSDVPTSSASLCAQGSPLKGSDAESSASSPGPAPSELNLKDLKKTECPYCGKNFQYRSSFRRHLKIHQGIYTHICAACSRKFTRKEHFVRHKCNRKPNIPNRSASRVEMTPESMLPTSKLPQPKVAYPPTLDEHQISSMMAADLVAAAAYNSMSSPLTSSTGPAEDYLPPPPPPLQPIINDEAPMVPVNESRRKKAQPRKLVVEDDTPGVNGYMDDVEDEALRVYESPVHTPISISPMDDDSSSPEDLSQNSFMPRYSYDKPMQEDNWHQKTEEPLANTTTMYSSTRPIEITPRDAISSDTISTSTGTYQIEQVDDDACPEKCIKVTKQSNYLKLRKEAQLINGQLCFVCPHCSKVFHRSSNFSRHMRIHRGVFSYICPACNRGFYRKEHFQKHKCARKSMSRIWSRKTKLEMAAAGSSDGEKENLSDSLSDGGLEDGIDLGPDTTEEESSGEEGSLIVDESAGMDEEEEEMNSPLPPPVPVDVNEH